MKVCKRCGSYFEKRCRTCANIYALQYRGSHQVLIKAAELKWRILNKEKITARVKEWRIRTAEKRKEYKYKWYAKNKTTALAYAKAWAKSHPKERRISQHNREAKNSGGVLSKGLAEKLFKLQKGKCPCCGKKLGLNYHLDHITPLSKGGANTDCNIQLLRDKCNMEKHTKHPIAFMQEKGFLI